MWNRACPLCFTKVPRGLVLTRVDELTCPCCHAALELSRPSKVLGATMGLVGGWAVFRIGLTAGGDGNWIVPVAGAVLGYALGSALILLLFSDLVVRPKVPAENFPQSHR